ncbi:hypothetical protein FEM48_Zijuj01G0165000 [Ziziphus jujuba var. spinosa]|uniref:NB-ARC domain-containing protein n=1 Tax=Ziziphus jujuba var. spinosa TaxID=714518 RepID=A0A978W2B8_ZIZJJ|nr:disease resistance protein At4g27190-like [Ziziphus jujuba var. spinosa]KAH7546102.1 hypothetical protein FEM48_Zijuj01G0165000 [Ziziphus jujuba var. spinosa]
MNETKKNFTIGVLPQPKIGSCSRRFAGSFIESPDLCPIAKQVLSECGGLPIAISTVGRALQYKSKEIWKNALRQLRKATPDHISGLKIDVYGKIELSYDCLESEEAKSCLLLCCLYNKSSYIPIEDLIRHMLGLGLFKDIESVADGRNSVIASIDILKSCFLLMDSKKEGCVEMHEVVRDVALSIASKSENTIVASHGVKLKDWPKSGVHRQFYTSTVMTSSGIDNRRDGTKPKLLLVSCTDASSIPPNTILDGMEKLKVLEMRRANLESILPSLPCLKHLQTLCLEHCILQDVSVIGELQTLLILSLRNSDIKELPSKIGYLSNLRLLDLARCDNLLKISPGVISSFGKLEELYMGGTSVRWMAWEQGKWVANMILLELLSIRHLTTLEIGLLVLIPEIIQENITFFNNLERFKISIGSQYAFWDVTSCENHLRLQHNSDDVWSEICDLGLRKLQS